MKASKNQIVLLFLQDAQPITVSQLGYRWQNLFGEQSERDFLYPALRDLVSESVVGEFDVEYSGLFDFASAEHTEHGEISFDDLQGYFNLSELLGLSSGAANFVLENAPSLLSEASKLGLDQALDALSKLPVDSSAWTGAPKGFRFTQQNRSDLLRMLRDAEMALDRSGLTNSEIGQGKGLVRAAIILLNLPDPPENEIWAVINRASAIATLTSFFVGIIKYLEALK